MPAPNASRSGTSAILLPNAPNGYKFNLSPHKWSRPVDPRTIDSNVSGKSRTSFTSANNIPDSLRRGIIWRLSSYADLVQPEKLEYRTQQTTSTKNIPTTKGLFKKQVVTTTSVPVKRTGFDNRFGFQFLYNPTDLTSSLSLATDINPEATDKFLATLGIYQGRGVIDIKLFLDRTNDFACFRGSKSATSAFASYYENSSIAGGIVDASTKIQLVNDLMKKGTLADIEYLYSAINGGNLVGIDKSPSADVGFLAVAALRLDLGPMHYVGMVSGITIRHIAFTQDMIPIRSEVSITFLRLGNYGLNQDTGRTLVPDDKAYVQRGAGPDGRR